jgi:hypothetical protein
MDLRDGLGSVRIRDTFCVNQFAETELYQEIQPKYYVFADPLYWSSAAPENEVSSRKHLFDRILSKTSWPVTLYLPFEARDLFEGIFSRARNIRLVFYNNVPLYGAKGILNILYDLGLGIPPAQNVLIPALILSLRLGYKKIILLGADHSWHETIALDDANRVCWKDRHFYNTDAKLTPISIDGAEENLFTMDTIFQALGRMFEGYWKIEEYAKRLGAQVYNASSVTFIDAFKRRAIADMLVELSEDGHKDS